MTPHELAELTAEVRDWLRQLYALLDHADGRTMPSPTPGAVGGAHARPDGALSRYRAATAEVLDDYDRAVEALDLAGLVDHPQESRQIFRAHVADLVEAVLAPLRTAVDDASRRVAGVSAELSRVTAENARLRGQNAELLDLQQERGTR